MSEEGSTWLRFWPFLAAIVLVPIAIVLFQLHTVDLQLNAMNEKIASAGEELPAINSKIDTDMNYLQKQVDSLGEQFAELGANGKTFRSELEKQFDDLRKRLSELDANVKKINELQTELNILFSADTSVIKQYREIEALMNSEMKSKLVNLVRSFGVYDGPGNLSMTLGALVPQTVQLVPGTASEATANSALRSYNYTLKNNKLIVVEGLRIVGIF